MVNDQFDGYDYQIAERLEGVVNTRVFVMEVSYEPYVERL